MTYKNIDVVEEFVNFGLDEKIKAKHLFFEQDVLYSYGSHFPLCIRLKDCWIINTDGYSMTTNTHKGHLIRSLTDCYNLKELQKRIKEFLEIKLKDTKEIKEICFNHLQNKEGLRFITFEELNRLRIIKNLN